MSRQKREKTTKVRPRDDGQQLERFREIARKLGVDESPGALDRAFARLDPKKRPTKP